MRTFEPTEWLFQESNELYFVLPKAIPLVRIIRVIFCRNANAAMLIELIRHYSLGQFDKDRFQGFITLPKSENVYRHERND